MEVFAKRLFDGTSFKENVLVSIEKQRIVGIETTNSPQTKADVYSNFLMPAIIDAHSHIGLERHGEENSDTNEKEDSVITFGDALDGIQMDDKSFRNALEGGVLYSCVMHGSGNIIGSKAVVIRNFSQNTKDAFVKYAGYKAALGYNPTTTQDWRGVRFSTRIGVLSLLRKNFLKARNELKLISKGKKEEEELSPSELFFIKLLKKEEFLRVHLHKEDDLYALLRLKDEFGFDCVIEHTCDFHKETPYLELRNRGIPVVYGPLDSFAYKEELKHEDWRNIRFLLSSKVKFGLMSDHPVILTQSLLLTLRWFLYAGLSEDKALSLITKANAEILGLENLGEIKEGKLASLVSFQGDPFNLRNRVDFIIKEGKLEEFSL